ncbi:MFS transporter [Peribacillus asahii]|uniref:MFS transporter n=1 Tax=Peribacillus asahii TaxID=228899 RepID=UPI0037FFC5DB
MSNLNTNRIIENSKFNRFHAMILFWGTFIIILDGYDLAVYGAVLPVLIEDWGLSNVEAGAMGSYGLIGVMIGAFFFGPLADRVGRKNVILICFVLFSLFTGLCGTADSPTTFSTYRFIAGLGLGGIMPNVIALMTDYSPKSMRSLTVSIILCGYSVGGMLAPALSIYLIPSYGWEIVYMITAAPLILLPFMWKYLPDATVFLAAKGRTEELRQIMNKINPAGNYTEKDHFEKIDIKQEAGIPVIQLFKNNRALSTSMFWIAYFMCLLVVYGLSTWLPKLMMQAGYGLNSSLSFLIIMHAGTIVGTLIIAKLADRYGSKKMLVPMYTIGAICLFLMSFKSDLWVICLLVAITGACTVGAQNIANAYVSQYYPPFLRSTALGVASGVGRIGAILGPTIGGILLTMNLPIQINFLAFAIPGVIASIAFFFIPVKHAYDYTEKTEDSDINESDTNSKVI